METKRWYLAVPLGDPAGIGPEIVLKAMQRINLPPSMGMVVIGDVPLLKKVSTDLGIPSDFDAVVVDDKSLVRATESGSRHILYSQNILDMQRFSYGEIQAMCGRAAYHAVEEAVRLIGCGYAHALVTPPLHKEALKAAGVDHVGYTEILSALSGAERAITMFDTLGLKIFFHSRHLSLRQACDAVTKESLLKTILECDAITKSHGGAFRNELSLAVAGLNPHCGEHGLFGDEEERAIEPAIKEAREHGVDVAGPIGADSVFYQARVGKYRAVISLYHDQGHIAAKTYDFNQTISITWNLPFLRTSVDHGTAFDIAGKNLADAAGMVRALEAAADYLLAEGER
ncbi:MAG: 4-hydroxythreonine-4-phosphate dehydrogenase [Spirochaeta sp.]|jgi:4-hydroxythreonine-4-phosphate dehydrogenase|uniref:4-hydroxythreonine-4-phosphate dehydrogenase PdxA n=1 Tax=Sphaerochaeta sp. TaxID=1972642 RepID=UPI003D148756|nr:4-hydroxythreonine-4-phosphate dehydrogenase [Spirochaeta sp.]